MLRSYHRCSKKVADDATTALYTSGEGQKIYDKWFMQQTLLKGLNLNSPIGAELGNEFAYLFRIPPDPDSYKVQCQGTFGGRDAGTASARILLCRKWPEICMDLVPINDNLGALARDIGGAARGRT